MPGYVLVVKLMNSYSKVSKVNGVVMNELGTKITRSDVVISKIKL